MLTYRRSDQLEIVGYTDSDFVRCQDNIKSTLCYIYLLVRGIVSWKIVKKSIISSSTMVVEFIAYY